MDTNAIQTKKVGRSVYPVERWQVCAANGELVKAIAEFMSLQRDWNQQEAERAVFRFIRSLPKRSRQ